MLDVHRETFVNNIDMAILSSWPSVDNKSHDALVTVMGNTDASIERIALHFDLDDSTALTTLALSEDLSIEKANILASDLNARKIKRFDTLQNLNDRLKAYNDCRTVWKNFMNGLLDLNTSEAASTSTSFEENSSERAYKTLESSLSSTDEQGVSSSATPFCPEGLEKDTGTRTGSHNQLVRLDKNVVPHQGTSSPQDYCLEVIEKEVNVDNVLPDLEPKERTLGFFESLGAYGFKE
ncbi:hypothetical protein PHYBLDRAFT_149032 [Phycomyces blakesleeanus NRRL 1555(-)]|uniref:Uncharacterized protein n=1 Tax=Phycomyces blakesleeanus (strain ATCC 8743b / DSM 1359 / FGSC 10004 / NBRC 33097 / NRRL 1555) TaxID=763407 RepID=A0A163D9Z9_PHYB8|nr:hypothetical protein PHYBLDRAFT_149032 [Phycomyces blakesleeanus NRRL 1555(-)]OAD69850.1 hypothetical protein PHYBLDRAFT_149032 [Phycomyces blakesleeanus NRRL 1555(-)]|eukprot:XP_018287890.1 hypothetical protein PHYBLDRAFT_149032 [Phycomyces blakesleeanus NRRL 1555(-)]